MNDAQLFAKGSVVRSTMNFLQSQEDGSKLREVLALLPPETRERLQRAEPTEELPYAMVRAMWEAADQVIGRDDRRWAERAGALSIESTGVQLYSGILRKSSPSQFLTQSISLFRLYYRPGDMEVVQEAPGRVVLRLVGFDAGTPLFCERQTGGLRCAISLAGGVEPVTRHVRCALEGDAFCEWELGWGVGQ